MEIATVREVTFCLSEHEAKMVKRCLEKELSDTKEWDAICPGFELGNTIRILEKINKKITRAINAKPAEKALSR